MQADQNDPLIPTKVCSNPQCEHAGEPQPFDNFGRNDSVASGLSYYCRTCASRSQQAWKKAHPEQAKKWRREYIERNKARNKARRDAAAPTINIITTAAITSVEPPHDPE